MYNVVVGKKLNKQAAVPEKTLLVQQNKHTQFRVSIQSNI